MVASVFAGMPSRAALTTILEEIGWTGFVVPSWFTPLATGALFLANVWLAAAVMWILVGAVAAVDGWR